MENTPLIVKFYCECGHETTSINIHKKHLDSHRIKKKEKKEKNITPQCMIISRMNCAVL
jgi:hypothetical protein